jgi:DnaJ-class molecular chaperone
MKFWLILGIFIVFAGLVYSFVESRKEPCVRCLGTGTVGGRFFRERRCPDCGGDGRR